MIEIIASSHDRGCLYSVSCNKCKKVSREYWAHPAPGESAVTSINICDECLRKKRRESRGIIGDGASLA